MVKEKTIFTKSTTHFSRGPTRIRRGRNYDAGRQETLRSLRGGWMLECQGGAKNDKDGRQQQQHSSSSSPCRFRAFPRIDPAAIVLVTFGEWLLLGRKAEWTTGRFSLLAGFVELGETIEQGAIREVYEESGVRLAPESVRCVRSQPWPLPQSLMVGLHAHARGSDARRRRSQPKAGEKQNEEEEEEQGIPEWLVLSEEGNSVCGRGQGGITEEEVTQYLGEGGWGILPPVVDVSKDELEDCRWFHRDFILAAFRRHHEDHRGGDATLTGQEDYLPYSQNSSEAHKR